MVDLSENERELLSIVWSRGPLARSEIVTHTKLTQQSVHRLLEGLREKRLLSFGEAEIRGRGKPSPMVAIDTASHVSAGIAINGNEIRYCIADLKGTPLEQRVLTADPNDRDAVIERLHAEILHWRQSQPGALPLIGIGVAVQGYRTGPGDQFHPTRRLSNWRGIPIEALIRDRFGVPTFVENNASSSATAEHFLGGGSAYDCFAYLSFNYGFGVGLMSQRRVFLGQHGNAGEIGPLFTEEQKPHRPALNGLITRLNENGVPIGSLDQLVREFRADWPGIESWLQEIRPLMQLTIRALKAIADPGAIFFGGDAPPELRARLIEVASSAFGRELSPNPKLLPSGIEGDAAHLGAAFLPLHKQLY